MALPPHREVLMITTPVRTAEEITVAPSAPTPRSDTRSWLAERISTETGVLLAATWYVLFVIGSALEPQSHAATPVWAIALSVVLFAVMAVMAVGLLVRRRWGVLASLGAGGLFTAAAVACPTTGHHPMGPWWFGQMACALGLVGASMFALRRPAA
jgi:hypothetical protein